MNSPHCRFSRFAGKRVHLGVCGSIAAYRALDALRGWIKAGLGVSATLTDAAQRFVTPLSFAALGAAPVYTRMFAQGDAALEAPFGHLEPGQTAGAMVIAPATAATLARLAQGAADDLLACQALAFAGPLVVAPAMNPRMWAHPATQANVATLVGRGVTVLTPGEGGTACGEEGQGRLADVRHVWQAALKALSPQDMAGCRVMVTLGPTREQWDAVRYWSNPSSGIMGAALVTAAWLRGAEVYALCGPCVASAASDVGQGTGVPWLPLGVRRVDVVSAREMFAAAQDLWPRMDMGLFTAAVADFAPEAHGPEKFRKADAAQGFSLRFVPNPDILRTLAANRREGQRVLGFAAETVEDLASAVRAKRADKGADILVGNRLNCAGSGFGASTNAACVVDLHGREEVWPQMSKADMAWGLCSWLLRV